MTQVTQRRSLTLTQLQTHAEIHFPDAFATLPEVQVSSMEYSKMVQQIRIGTQHGNPVFVELGPKGNELQCIRRGNRQTSLCEFSCEDLDAVNLGSPFCHVFAYRGGSYPDYSGTKNVRALARYYFMLKGFLDVFIETEHGETLKHFEIACKSVALGLFLYQSSPSPASQNTNSNNNEQSQPHHTSQDKVQKIDNSERAVSQGSQDLHSPNNVTKEDKIQYILTLKREGRLSAVVKRARDEVDTALEVTERPLPKKKCAASFKLIERIEQKTRELQKYDEESILRKAIITDTRTYIEKLAKEEELDLEQRQQRQKEIAELQDARETLSGALEKVKAVLRETEEASKD